MSKASEIAQLKAVISSQGGYRTATGEWEFAKYSNPQYKVGVEDGKQSGHKAGAAEERQRVAELLMDVLVVRDRYPDATRTVEGVRTRHVTSYGYFVNSYPVAEPYTYEVIDYGYVKFLADVEAVQKHTDFEAARERLGLD